jgi:hypothetical protein
MSLALRKSSVASSFLERTSRLQHAQEGAHVFSNGIILYFNTVELHFSGLIGTSSHPDMHKIRIIGFFFENRLHW